MYRILLLLIEKSRRVWVIKRYVFSGQCGRARCLRLLHSPLHRKSDYPTFVQHVAMWDMTLGAYRFRLFFTGLKQKQTRLWLGLKENFTWSLIFSFLLPAKGESEVYYVDLALHFLVPVPPIMCFIISIPEKWKTDVGVMEGWRQ